MNTRAPTAPRRGGPPAWLSETVEVLDHRRTQVRAVAILVCLAAAAVAVLLPDLLPATPETGAVVALAALVLATVTGVALDAADTTVRGARHVRALGGGLRTRLPVRPDPAAAAALASDLLAEPRDGKLVLGLAAASNHGDVAGWVDALGVAIAEEGPSVLVVDVASGSTPADGVLEVVRDGVPLGRAVTFERDLKLARLGAGRDGRAALGAAASFVARLPRDLEVLLVALPPLTAREVVAAAGALDRVLVGAVADVTARVRLQAALEALAGTGARTEVVLFGGRGSAPSAAAADRPSRRPSGADDPDHDDAPDAPDDPDHDDDPDRDPGDPDGTAPGPPSEEDAGRPGTHPGASAGPRPLAPGLDGSARTGAGPIPTGVAAADLGRRPSPTVRVVRDLPPSVRRPASDPEPEPVLTDDDEPDEGPELAADPDPGAGDVAPTPVVPDPGVDLDAAPDDASLPPLQVPSFRRDVATPTPAEPEASTPAPRDEVPPPAPEEHELAVEVADADPDPDAEADPDPDPEAAGPEVVAVAEVEVDEPEVAAAAPEVGAREDAEAEIEVAPDLVAPQPPSPAPLAARPVEVLAAAEAASLAARLDQRAAESPPADETAGVVQEPSSEPAPAAVGASDPVPADGADTATDARADVPAETDTDADEVPLPGEDDPTDELPAVTAARVAQDPEDDPLRTTAQLAILLDELRDRDDADDAEDDADDADDEAGGDERP